MKHQVITQTVKEFIVKRDEIVGNIQHLSFEEYGFRLGKALSAVVKPLPTEQRTEAAKLCAKEVTQNLRYYLYTRHPYCALCGHRFASISEATIDHIVPTSIGGKNTYKNKQLAHFKCNTIKGNRDIKSFRFEPQLQARVPEAYKVGEQSWELSI